MPPTFDPFWAFAQALNPNLEGDDDFASASPFFSGPAYGRGEPPMNFDPWARPHPQGRRGGGFNRRHPQAFFGGATARPQPHHPSHQAQQSSAGTANAAPQPTVAPAQMTADDIESVTDVSPPDTPRSGQSDMGSENKRSRAVTVEDAPEDAPDPDEVTLEENAKTQTTAAAAAAATAPNATNSEHRQGPGRGRGFGRWGRPHQRGPQPCHTPQVHAAAAVPAYSEASPHHHSHPHSPHGARRGPAPARAGRPPFGAPDDFADMMRGISAHPFFRTIMNNSTGASAWSPGAAATAGPADWLKWFSQDYTNDDSPAADTNTAPREEAPRKDTPRKDAVTQFNPPVDLFTTSSGFVLHVALPGVKKQDIGLDWVPEQGHIRITGKVHRTAGDEALLQTLTSSERIVGTFDRNVKLPLSGAGKSGERDEVDAEGISAKLKEGVLVVHVPVVEKEWTSVRKIDIN